MAYSKNPFVPRVRAQAVRLVVELGWPVTKAARYIGMHRATVYRWLEKSPMCGVNEIPTGSSRPHTSPHAIDQSIIDRILALRRPRGRCAQAIHAQLVRENSIVSLATVHRTLVRHGMVKQRSVWKKLHRSGERPVPENPGILVQMDSIHIMKNQRERIYIMSMLDVCTRWAYAWACPRLTTHSSLATVQTAQTHIPFALSCIQSDHGPEFSRFFTLRINAWGMRHRLIRIRKPNDNAHVERFNRTIQDEMASEIRRYKGNLTVLNQEIKHYLTYYNTERLHMGINYQTPLEVSQRY